MTWSDVLFLFFAALTVIPAFLCVALAKNIIRGAFLLMLTFWGVAGLYGVLGADFLMAAQLIVGISQHDFWPFSPYPVIAESASRFREATWYEARLVDSAGNEAAADGSPLTRSVLSKWIELTFTRLNAEQRQRAASFLITRDAHCRNDRILRNLTAPDWLWYRGNRRMPGSPLALRMYRCDVQRCTLIHEQRAE